MLKTYILSLAAGILVGVLYAVIDVSSPAPPIIALLDYWRCKLANTYHSGV